jgi:hypothetical protein
VSVSLLCICNRSKSVSDAAPDYNIPAIRALMMEAFTPQDLRRFCQDHPFLRPVISTFGPNQGLDDMVDEVIDHCETRFLWEELLEAVSVARWGQYRRYQPDLGQAAPLPPPRPSPRLKTARTIRIAWLAVAIAGVLLVLIIVLIGLSPRNSWPDSIRVRVIPTWTGVIETQHELVIVTVEVEEQIGELEVSKTYLGFEPYAQLDRYGWETAIGTPYEVEIGGQSLGYTPWIAVGLGLTNPSPDEGQKIVAANLHVSYFEPVGVSSGYTLVLRTDLAPSFLVPQDCDESGGSPTLGLKGIELPEAEHLFGILPASKSVPTQLWRGGEADLYIPPKENREYLLFISANAPGKYRFSVDIELESTDRVTSTLELGSWTYAFLDADTALHMPTEYDGPRCPP